jgi:membrane-associated protease RseP (regulator of RpoE activity)
MIVLAAVALLYLIINADIPGTWKFGLGVIEMFFVGNLLIKKYSLSGEHGMIMLKTKKGLKLIDNLAKNAAFWQFFADAGIVMCYGLLSYFIMRKHFYWKSALAGFVGLFLVSALVSPMAVPFLAENITGILPAKTTAASSGDTSSFVLPIGLILLIGGGFFLAIMLGLLYYGFTVLYAVVSTLAFGSTAMAETKPGATLLLPGVNLPFIEGIAALIIILIVHEGAHAILGRIAKVPVLSSGIVLFGIIPVGAFIEPDEEYLKRVEKTKQTRVLAAGSSSNLFFSIILFILFMAFLYATVPYRESGLLVISGLEKDTIIYSINGHDATDYQNIAIGKNENVVLDTNKGQMVIKTNAEGKMGIQFYVLDKAMLIARFKFLPLTIIYLILGLSFALNFVIGTINLLPLPFFDGYRIMELNVKSKLVVNGLMYLTIAGFLLNILPHFFV